VHNNGFSGLAGIIAGQLKPINALLAVRPDHSKKAEPLEYTSPEGKSLVLFDGSVTRASSNAARNEEKHHIRLILGGPEGLRSIAYIALTFFAHHFQQHARKVGVQPVKDFVLGSGQNEFVWWESSAILATVPKNEFEFGHTIVLTTSSATGEATALVSLFQCLNFGIALAKLEGLSDESVVVFIDPHADHPPDDIRSLKENSLLLKLDMPNPLHAYLEKMIHDGVGQKSLQQLLQNIEEWKFRKEMAPVLERLNAVRALPPVDQGTAIASIVQEQVNRIYRIMRFIADNFESTQKGKVAADRIAPLFKAMVEVSDDDASTLGELGQLVLIGSVEAIANELSGRLAKDEIDMEYLWRLFSGGHGAGIVGKRMSDLVIQSL
jgi:hypothetical protein